MINNKGIKPKTKCCNSDYYFSAARVYCCRNCHKIVKPKELAKEQAQ